MNNRKIHLCLHGAESYPQQSPRTWTNGKKRERTEGTIQPPTLLEKQKNCNISRQIIIEQTKAQFAQSDKAFNRRVAALNNTHYIAKLLKNCVIT